MSNEKASLGLGHSLVDLTNRINVFDTLCNMISVDNDLTENEMYFRNDTIKLGFENEAERIVMETLKEFGYPTNKETFEEVATKVFEAITEQEYFGNCELNIIELDENKLSLAYAYGGNYSD